MSIIYCLCGEKMGGFKFLEHMSDAYIMAWGKTLEEAFEYAALGMFETMTDTSKVKHKVVREIEVDGIDLFSLLYNWLEELLYYFDAEALLFSKFKVHEIGKKNEKYYLRGIVLGEPFDESRHISKNAVKAVTYSLMEINRKNGEWILKFVLDL